MIAPEQGGELWIELQQGDQVNGEIQRRAVADKYVYGQVRSIVEEEPIQFHPRRYHEVSEWTGDRLVLIAYTPDCLGKLSQDVLEQLHELRFPIPISQLPEYHGGASIPVPIHDESPIKPSGGGRGKRSSSLRLGYVFGFGTRTDQSRAGGRFDLSTTDVQDRSGLYKAHRDSAGITDCPTGCCSQCLSRG